MHYVYILRSEAKNNKTYIGSTNDLKRRLRDHNGGQCNYTKQYIPWKIVYFERVSKENAVKRERQIKKWSREKKAALIRGDLGRLRKLAKKKI